MRLVPGICALALLLVSGCAPASGGEGRILVFAAASLGEAFTEIATRFEARNPDLSVDLHLAGTSRLAFQIGEGAPADVFASADVANMAKIVARGLVVDGPHVFARNELAIATAVGNPLRVRGLADFARDDLRLALCGPEVPAGQYAREAFRRAGVDPRPGSDEPHVKAVVAKIELGEVDAGVVYRTDIDAAPGRVHGIVLPAVHQVTAECPIAALSTDGRPALAARAFVDFVLGGEGRAVLAGRGFQLP